MFEGPLSRNQNFKAWRSELLGWREQIVKSSGYTGAAYENAAVNWTRTSYVQVRVFPSDRYLYDPTTHAYTVDRYLDDLQTRYGGIDSVIIWPQYPNIGIDARNGFDFWRCSPGGLEALKDMTGRFHSRGVKVLWGYQPWDQSTREDADPHWETLAKLLKQVGADGFSGDTMYTMYKEFWQAGEEIGHPIVGDMEGGGYPTSRGWMRDSSWQSLNWSPMGWLELHGDAWQEPGVDKAKWLDARGRRMTHVLKRYDHDRHEVIQLAHFNGIGYEAWENIWSSFNKLTARDAEALKRVSSLWHWLGEAEFIQNYADWEPHTPDLAVAAGQPREGVFGSRWRHASGACAWIEGFGYGALLLCAVPPPGLHDILAKMMSMTRTPLADFSTDWLPLQQKMVGHAVSRATPPESTPTGMLYIPRAPAYEFKTAANIIEGGCDLKEDQGAFGACCVPTPTNTPPPFSTPPALRGCPGAESCFDQCAWPGATNNFLDVQFPWEDAPNRFHSKVLDLGPFYIDKTVVTKANFSEFLVVTSYRPHDSTNFLEDWQEPKANRYAVGEGEKPVVYVSLTDARAYCAWRGLRLPHVYEWQLAAQGNDGRPFPWGSDRDATDVMPEVRRGRQVPVLPDVGSYPKGVSPHGMLDALGLVWQLTDEFHDEHTRSVILKGSSLYNPVLSGEFPALRQPANWYFPPARRLTLHGKWLLFDDAYDRAATLSFRCVGDHPEGAPAPLHYRPTEPSAEL